MFSILKNNIIDFLKNTKRLAIMFIGVQFCSVILIMASYGILNHYDVMVEEIEGVSLTYTLNFEDGSKSEINAFFSEVLPILNNKLNYFYIDTFIDELNIQVSSGYKNGVFIESEYIEEKMDIKSGNIFSVKNMNSSEKVALVKPDLDNGEGYIDIGGERYNIIGVYDDGWQEKGAYVPYKALPDDVVGEYIVISLDKTIFENEYILIKEIAEKAFGDSLSMSEFEGIYNESNNRVYRGTMIIVVLLMIVCAIDYCIVFKCVLEKRKKKYAIARICGCSKYLLGAAYLIELFIYSTTILCIGIILYNYIAMPWLAEFFEYITKYSSVDIYISISLIYELVLFIMYILMIFKYISKSPVWLIKEV